MMQAFATQGRLFKMYLFLVAITCMLPFLAVAFVFNGIITVSPYFFYLFVVFVVLPVIFTFALACQNKAKRQRRDMILVRITCILLPLALYFSFISLPACISYCKNETFQECSDNLRVIENAKLRYALQKGITNSTSLSLDELGALSGKDELRCPMGGVYTINPIGTAPKCSYHSCPTQEAIRNATN